MLSILLSSYYLIHTITAINHEKICFRNFRILILIFLTQLIILCKKYKPMQKKYTYLPTYLSIFVMFISFLWLIVSTLLRLL